MSRTALITGASSGIGYELALLLARDGFDCILVARSRDKLNELAARLESEYRVKTLVLPKDLSKPSAVDEIYEETRAASMPVNGSTTEPQGVMARVVRRAQEPVSP